MKLIALLSTVMALTGGVSADPGTVIGIDLGNLLLRSCYGEWESECYQQ